MNEPGHSHQRRVGCWEDRDSKASSEHAASLREGKNVVFTASNSRVCAAARGFWKRRCVCLFVCFLFDRLFVCLFFCTILSVFQYTGLRHLSASHGGMLQHGLRFACIDASSRADNIVSKYVSPLQGVDECVKVVRCSASRLQFRSCLRPQYHF